MKKKVALCMVFAMIVSLFPVGKVNATATVDLYPYVLFAASEKDGAVSITADDICINGAVATNGTTSVTGRANLNGAVTEQAGEPAMVVPTRLYESYFAGDDVLTYEEAVVLENQNNMNDPVMGYDEVVIRGNANVNDGLCADGNILFEGDSLNGNGGLLCTFGGDIRITANNVNLNGLIYAPFGKVVIYAQYVNMNRVIVIADSIEINAKGVNLNYSPEMAAILGSETEYDEDELLEDEESQLGDEDVDGDGLTATMEQLFETDPLLADTDSDGLTDYEEIYLTNTDPVIYDSVQTGVPDLESDIDGDGLSNKEELLLGTRVGRADTEFDGLTDYEEINVYGTNPLMADTDGDGVVDGWEIANGYNPLTFDAQFTAKTELTTEGSDVAVEALTEGTFMNSFALAEVTDNVLFDGELFAYISRPVELVSEDTALSGIISFTYEDEWEEDCYEPQIYVFNPDTQCMDALETELSGGVATAEVTRAGIYALINSVEFDLLLSGAFEMSLFATDTTTDSNKDGLSDYHTRRLCNGILLSTGATYYPFGNYSYEEVQANPDIDHDGVLNGYEIISYSGIQALYGIMMKSNPIEPDTDFDGIWDGAEAEEYRMDNSFKGTMYNRDYDLSVSFTVDYRLFFGDNTVYNRNLSLLASMFATDMYDESYINVKTPALGSSKETTAKPNGVALAEMFGLLNVRNYDEDDFLSVAGGTDLDDVSEFVIGHKPVTYNGQTKEVIFLAVRGTNGTQAEWSSNFDVGANVTNYTSKTGAHPDWRFKENHKGFDVTATRIWKLIYQYMIETGLAASAIPKTFFITGHSRGAAVANTLGGYLETKTSFETFVYTFATPYTTTAANARSCKTIFNVINTDDLVTYLPLKMWGFERFGTDKCISVEDYYERTGGSLPGSFEEVIGGDYDGNGQVDNVMEKFQALAKTRDAIYTYDDDLWFVNRGYFKKVNAQERLEEERPTLEKEKLLRYCKYYVGKQGLLWHVWVDYGTAYFMQVLANLASGVGPTLGREVNGKYDKAKTAFIWGSGEIFRFGGMEHPHMMPTYYLIVMNDFKSIK